MRVPDVSSVFPAAGSVRRDESVLLADLPVLAEILGVSVWEGEITRGERALFIFCRETGGVGALLKVGNPPLKLSVSGPSIDETLAALEASLRLPAAPWQPDDSPVGQRRRRR